MKTEKTMAQHYLETKILGAYETAEVVCEEEMDGKCAPCFEDALLVFHEGQTTMDRFMIVEGKRFRIRSIFTADTGITPTDKMLDLINSDIEKGRIA